MALYVLIAEGYTDCALLEAILEKNMGFKRYEFVADMPELFQRLVGNYPSSIGEMKRQDMPHFFHNGGKKAVVKVSGGATKLAVTAADILEALALCSEEEKLGEILAFTDKDQKSEDEVLKDIEKDYQTLDMEYSIKNEELIFEQKHYLHSVYIYPQKGFGAIEKILLDILYKICPELFDVSMDFREQLMREEFSDLRKKSWASEKEIQEFYGDKVQFGAAAMALKPDRPVGFAIKDKIITTSNWEKLSEVDEFCKLCSYLKKRIQ